MGGGAPRSCTEPKSQGEFRGGFFLWGKGLTTEGSFSESERKCPLKTLEASLESSTRFPPAWFINCFGPFEWCTHLEAVEVLNDSTTSPSGVLFLLGRGRGGEFFGFRVEPHKLSAERGSNSACWVNWSTAPQLLLSWGGPDLSLLGGC